MKQPVTMVRRFELTAVMLGIGALMGACQTPSGGLAPDVASRLAAAGYVSRSTDMIANPTLPGVSLHVDGLYACPKERCGSPVVVFQSRSSAAGNFFGMTLEEAVRKKTLRDSTWEDLLNACVKSIQPDAELSGFRQYTTANEAGAAFEFIGKDKAGVQVYGSGRFMFRQNNSRTLAAISTDRKSAGRGLALLMSGDAVQ